MPSLHASSADRNLLFGILALQMDFIDREALVKAMSAWVLDKTKPLGHMLRDLGALGQDELTLLEALVEKHLQKHGNDPEKSLAAVNAFDTSVSELKAIADTDVQASLAQVPDDRTLAERPAESDPFTTQALSGSNSASATERYRVLRPHAKGGLGQVSVALDQELHREVALKEIQNQFADNLDNRARFLVEAEITGRLEHPGIVPVYGLGQYADGRPYYAMRFIRGDNLKEAVKRFHEADGSNRDSGARAIEFRQMLGRFLDVCNAMAYAHARGVLHRDLKPGNIMLGQYGETLVVDWGLAKLLTQKEAATPVQEQPLSLSSSTSGSAETIAGSAIGTPQFMSPEQAAGRLDLLGPASDVYSLGATLYFVLTNKPAFEDPEVGTVLKKVSRGEFPSPRKVKPDVPPALEAVCLKAMALKREERYTSPRELANDIEHWLADEPVSAWQEPWTARAMRWGRRHRTLVVGGVASLLIVAILAVAVSIVNQQKALTEAADANAAMTSIKEQQQRQRAEELAEDDRRARVAACVSNGVRYMDEGQMEKAAVWFAEALRLDKQHPEKVAVHRLRLAAAWQRCAKLLLQHAGAINSAEFSPDGLHVVTASSDSTAQVWDVLTGRPIGEPLKHMDVVRHAGFSPDPEGRYVVTSSVDHTALRWDASTGKPVGPVLQHADLVRRAVYSPDGSRLVTVSQDRTAQIWDTQTGKALAKLAHDRFVYLAAFSPDGKRLVTACADDGKTVRVWNASTGDPMTLPLKNENYVKTAAFSSDGKQFVTGTNKGDLQIREVATGDPLATVRLNGSDLDRVAYTADGKHIVSVNAMGTTLLWDVSLKRIPISARAHWGNNPAYSPDGRFHLYWSSNDQFARLRDEAAGRPGLATLGSLKGASLHQGGKAVVAVGADKRVRVCDPLTGKGLSPAFEESDSINMAWLSPNEQRILGHDDLTARVWDARTGKALTEPMKHAKEIKFAALSPDGRRVVTIAEHSLRTWDATTGKLLAAFPDHKDDALHAAFSPDGKLVVSSGQDNTARLWSADTGKALSLQPLRHPTWVKHADFSPDGALVVTASSRSAYLWEVASGKLVSEFKHEGRVAQANFSPDGRRVVTLSDDLDDRTVRIWNLGSSASEARPLLHKSIPRFARFSSDGLRVLTGTDQYARVWDSVTGDPITPLLEHGFLADVGFAPDGISVITVSKLGSVRTWNFTRDERPIDDVVQLTQVVSGYRVHSGGGLEPCPSQHLRECSEMLRAKYKADFNCPLPAVLAWHKQEAADAENAGQWKEVLMHLDALVKEDPADMELRQRRGKVFGELAQWDKALAEYTQALAGKGEDADVYYQRARANARLGKLDKALLDYGKALELHPDNGAAWLGRHMINSTLGQIEAAKSDYEKAIALTGVNTPPIDNWWNKRNSRPATFTRHWLDIRADCSAIINSPNLNKNASWWAWRARGLARGVLGEWKAAGDDFSIASDLKDDDWRSWQGRARAFAELDNAHASVEFAAKKATSLRPDDWGSWFLLGISQSRRELHAAAIEAFTEANQRGAKDWGVFVERGFSHYGLKDYDQSITDYSSVLAVAKDARSYNNRANAYMAKGQFQKALDDYSAAAPLDPKNAVYATNRGILFVRMKLHDKAFAEFDAAIRLDPKYVVALLRKGDLHLQRKENEDAVVAFSRALEINPNNAYAFGRRALAYTHLEDYDRALFDYTEAGRLNPKEAATYKVRTKENQQLALAKKLPGVLKGDAATVGELLELADLCRRNDKQQYADVAALYARIFAENPKTAEDLGKYYRYNAACYAALAAAGQGVGADKLDAKEQARLRQQALIWLRADLAAREKRLADGPFAAEEFSKRMHHWQHDTDLTILRDVKELAKLPAGERAELTQFWNDVERLGKKAAASFHQAEFTGRLTAKNQEMPHTQKMTVGKTYVIEMTSPDTKALDPLLRLIDADNKVVAENDDISYPDNLNSRIVFSPRVNGDYRIVATSFQRRGIGDYTITVCEFDARKN